MDKTKVHITDSLEVAMDKLARGNTGARMALEKLVAKTMDIDPSSTYGALTPLLSLDAYNIYGASIYCLWSGKCKKDITTLILLIKSVELGFLSKEDLFNLAADRWDSINLSKQKFNDLKKLVYNRITDSNKELL